MDAPKGPLWCIIHRVLALAIPRTLPSRACSIPSRGRGRPRRPSRRSCSSWNTSTSTRRHRSRSRGHVPRHGRSANPFPRPRCRSRIPSIVSSFHHARVVSSRLVSLSLSLSLSLSARQLPTASVLAGPSECRD